MTERLYEGMFLVDSAEATRDWDDVEAHLRGLIEKHGGAIEYSERWPEQRLAYEVNGCKRGVYYLSYFRSDSQSITPLRADVELSDRVLRMMVVQEDFTSTEMDRRREMADRRAVRAAEAAEKAAAAALAAEAQESAEEVEADSTADTGEENAESSIDAAPEVSSEGPEIDTSAAIEESDSPSDGENLQTEESTSDGVQDAEASSTEDESEDLTVEEAPEASTGDADSTEETDSSEDTDPTEKE